MMLNLSLGLTHGFYFCTRCPGRVVRTRTVLGEGWTYSDGGPPSVLASGKAWFCCTGKAPAEQQEGSHLPEPDLLLA